METITFGFRKANASMATKLVVCGETKEYERGCLTNNSSFVDIWVKQKDLDKLEEKFAKMGFKKIEGEFGNERRN